MAKPSYPGLEALERVFGAFEELDYATPKWLTDPRTGQRLVIDKYYPELGIAIRLVDSETPLSVAEQAQDELLSQLCGRARVILLRIDPQNALSGEVWEQLCHALSAVSRRVAQWEGKAEVKLDLILRLSTAKASCREALKERVEPAPIAVVPSPVPARYRRSRWQYLRRRVGSSLQGFRRDWQIFAQNRLAVFGLVMILLFGLMSISHPVLRKTVWKAGHYNPETGYDMNVMHPAEPSSAHLLGTDSLGRDVLSMLLFATTSSFVVGIAAAGTTALIGTFMGVVSAYFGRGVDGILSRISDAFLMLPAPLFMVIIGMRFREIQPAVLGLIYGLIAGAGGAAIVMRSHALSIIHRPFIDSARVAGGGSWHIILKHVLPHMLPLAALYMMLSVTGAVVADGFISFWGFSRAYLNWGTMIYSSMVYYSVLGTSVEWHVLIPPSLALSLFAAAFYFVSRGLHELADPRLRVR